MNVTKLRFELEDPAEAPEIAALVEQRLSQLQQVERVQAEPVETRDPFATALTVIAVAVALSKGGADLLEQVRRILAELRGIVEESHGIARALVRVDDEDVELTRANVDDVAHALARSAD